MKVTESSESVLAGTKRPPFRMVVRAVGPDGTRLNIRPAVSEEFVVVTKRTKNLKKQEIPSLDDPISKLNHIGKETVKKLNEIKASADEMGLDLKLPRELWRYSALLPVLLLLCYHVYRHSSLSSSSSCPCSFSVKACHCTYTDAYIPAIRASGYI